MICQPKMEIKEMLEGNFGVLKATSENRAKRLKTRATTQAEKTAETVIKQMATKKLYIEKTQIEGQKQIVITEVALKVQGIKQIHEKAIEIQRQSF